MKTNNEEKERKKEREKERKKEGLLSKCKEEEVEVKLEMWLS